MAESKFNIEDFPKYYQIDGEGFICFVNDDGEKTRIARILKSGNLEAVGKTKISDLAAKKKRRFWVKIFLFLFFILAVCSAGMIFYVYEKYVKLNDEYLSLSVKYSEAVSEVLLVCQSELNKIETFINDSDEHSEDEIDDLIRKMKGISPNYCQSDSEFYSKFSELLKALYVMKGKITGKREAEKQQQEELERQQELERQEELERQRDLERQRELERQQELERELADMKQREAEQKKLEEEHKKAEQEKREKEEKERKKLEEKNKSKNAKAVKKENKFNKKNIGDSKKKTESKNRKGTTEDKPNTKIVKKDKAKEKPKAREEDDEEVSKLKQGIDELEEWLKGLKR